MPIPSLPNELARSIIEHVDEGDTQTLLALMNTSKVMQVEAERILHRTFKVSTSASNVIRYLESYQKLLEAYPRLAGYIAHFHLSDFGSTFMEEGEADALFTRIESILGLTTKLQEITIEDLAGHSRMHQMLMSLEVPVKVLTFETRSTHPPIEYERLLGSICANSHFTSLKHIDLHSKASGDDWSNRSSCPLERCSGEDLGRVLNGIQSLGGDGYILRRLLPFCKLVSSLRWYATDIYPTLKCCVTHACKDLLPNEKLDNIAFLWLNDIDEDEVVVRRR